MTPAERVIEAARETADWLSYLARGVVSVPQPVRQVAARKLALLKETLAALDAAPKVDLCVAIDAAIGPVNLAAHEEPKEALERRRCYINRIADAILAAGYRRVEKNTTEERGALKKSAEEA